MAKLADFEHEVIILLKEVHPTWELTKCAEIIPEFFSHISCHQFSMVVSYLSEFTTFFTGTL